MTDVAKIWTPAEDKLTVVMQDGSAKEFGGGYNFQICDGCLVIAGNDEKRAFHMHEWKEALLKQGND